MADLVDGTEGEDLSSEEQEAARKEEEKGDLALSDLFNIDEGEGDEEEGETETPTETPAADPRYDALNEQLATLREKQAELATENAIYKEQARSARTPAPAPQIQEPDDEIDLEELNKALADNPGKAVIDLINKVTVKALRKAETSAARVSSEITQTQAAFQSDHARAFSDFGDHWQKNKEFTDLAERFYDQLTQAAPVINREGQRYAPGAIHASMAAAYGQLVREGKISPKVVALRERKTTPAKPMIGSKSEESSGEDSLLSGIPAREVAAMKRTAAKLGVSWDKYKETIVKSVRKDPNFGGFRR